MSKRQDRLAVYHAAVTKVRELLNHWIESGLDLFLELRRIELAGDWRFGPKSHAGFQDFLSSEFRNTLGIERYNNVIQAIEIHGEGFIRRVGVHNCHALTVRELMDKGSTACEEVRASVLTHIAKYGCPPEQAETRKIVNGVIRKPARPAASTRAFHALTAAQAEITKLRGRVKELEAELADAKRESKRWREECERGRKQAANHGGASAAARKPARNVARSHATSDTR